VPKFLVLYKAGSTSDQTDTPNADQQDMMKAWFDWKGNAGDAIVDFGAPTMPVPGADSSVGGYSIVQADTTDALDAIFETNPHRRQGGSLEFHQIVDIPGE